MLDDREGHWPQHLRGGIGKLQRLCGPLDFPKDVGIVSCTDGGSRKQPGRGHTVVNAGPANNDESTADCDAQQAAAMPARIGEADRIIADTAVAIERLGCDAETAEAIPLEEPPNRRDIVPSPQIQQPCLGIPGLAREAERLSAGSAPERRLAELIGLVALDDLPAAVTQRPDTAQPIGVIGQRLAAGGHGIGETLCPSGYRGSWSYPPTQ